MATWLWQIGSPLPQELLWKGSSEGRVEGFSIILLCGREKNLLLNSMIYFSFYQPPHFQRPQNNGIALPPVPPDRCTSSPYSPLSRTPVFGWLLCEPLLIGGHPKATVYFIFYFFATRFATPKRLYGVPPTRSTMIASLLSPCWSAYLVTIVTFHYHTLKLGKRPQNQPNQENQGMLKVELAKRITTVCYY